MNTVALTAAQERALDDCRNLAVTAGAGSGKTRVLTQRYAVLLDRHPELEPDNLLALTFSDQAATEMRVRLAEDIGRRFAAALAAGKQDAARRWQRVQRRLTTAPIGTIHSFCRRLLAMHALAAGVDPCVPVLTGLDQDNARADAIGNTIRQLERDGDGDLRRLATLWPRGTLTGALETLLGKRDIARRWAAALENEPDDEASLEQLTAALSPTEKELRALFNDPRFVDPLSVLAPLTKHNIPEGDGSAAVLETVRALLSRTKAVQTLHQRGLMDLLVVWNCGAFLTQAGGPRSFSRAGSQANWKGRLDELAAFREAAGALALFLAEHRDLCEAIPGEIDRIALPLLRSLARVFRACDEAYTELKGDGLDYDDLLLLAADLLERSPDVRRAVRARYRHVLVDEVQDLDPIQWRIIRVVAAEPDCRATDQLGPDRLFVVGDDKQSIYRFRGADVTVARTLREAVRRANRKHKTASLPWTGRDGKPLEPDDGGGVIRLSDSFRAKNVPLGFCNAFFDRLFTAPGARHVSPFEVEAQPLVGHQGPGGGIELLWAEHGQAEARLVAQRVAELGRQYQWHEIALLLHRRTRLVEYEDALRAQGVPFVVLKGIGFYQRREVIDLYNVLQWLVDPRQEIALVGALRSPLFGLSDECLLRIGLADARQSFWQRMQTTQILPDGDRRGVEDALACLMRWRELVGRLPLADLLRRIVEETGYLGVISVGDRGAQNVANVEKLILVARDASRTGAEGTRRFVDRLRALIDSEEREGEQILDPGEGGGVRVMTIHAAKGMEFPVVILPDLASRFSDGEGASLRMDDVDGLPLVGIRVPDPENNYQRGDTLAWRALKRRGNEQMRAERKRLLYVGCTRAKEHLVLAGVGSDDLDPTCDVEDDTSWMEWVQRILGLEQPPSGDTTVSFAGLEIPVRVGAGEENPARPAARPLVLDRVEALQAGAEPAPLPWADGPLLAGARPQLSVTAFLTLVDCPRRYYYRQVLRIPDEAPGEAPSGRGPDESAAGRTRGTLVHELLEHHAPRPGVEAEARLAVEQQGFAGEAAETLLQSVLAEYRNAITPEFAALACYGEPGYSELRFELDAGSVILEGVIDRLVPLPEGGWRIVDYKTNQVRPEEVDDEIESHHYDLQMALYALAVRRLVGQSGGPVGSALLFTHAGVAREAAYTADALADLERTLHTLGTAVLSAHEGRPTSPALCEACPYHRSPRICRGAE